MIEKIKNKTTEQGKTLPIEKGLGGLFSGQKTVFSWKSKGLVWTENLPGLQQLHYLFVSVLRSRI